MFLVKELCTKGGGETETSSWPFSKKSKLGMSLNKQSEIIYRFYCMPKSWSTKTYYNYGTDHLFLPQIKLFKKTKRSGTSLPALFFYTIFEEKHLLSLLLKMLCDICIVIICFPNYNIENFEINFLEISFLVKPFSYMAKKAKKINYIYSITRSLKHGK